jgi:hypothetical protein
VSAGSDLVSAGSVPAAAAAAAAAAAEADAAATTTTTTSADAAAASSAAGDRPTPTAHFRAALGADCCTAPPSLPPSLPPFVFGPGTLSLFLLPP